MTIDVIPPYLDTADQTPRCARTDCGTPLTRRVGERPSAFRDRRYCDGTCERLRGGVDPVGHCLLPQCGVQLVRRANERPNQFRTRQFCCVGHRIEARRGRPNRTVPQVHGDWVPGERYTPEQLLEEWEHFSGFNPRMTPADLAERLRVSERTVQRALEVAS